jgi:hypothetical protein
MLMPIETNRMNALLTSNFVPKSLSEMNETKPLLWKNSSIEGTTRSKRLGLGKFSQVNNDCDSEKLTIDVPHLPLTEESSCSSPRRISFTQLDQGEDLRLFAMHETENAKPKKTVRFAPQLSTTVHSTKLWDGALIAEHCHELWYQKSELAAIKHAAKVTIANRSFVEGNPNASLNQRDELIGLERFSKQRAVWKKSAIRCVIIAQRQINNLFAGNSTIGKEDYIQRISLRCTEWARDAAEKQGFRDYCAVHDPLAELFSDSEDSDNENEENKQNYNELIFGDRTFNDTTTITSNKKRKVEVVYDDGSDQKVDDYSRRTRHRASPPLLL